MDPEFINSAASLRWKEPHTHIYLQREPSVLHRRQPCATIENRAITHDKRQLIRELFSRLQLRGSCGEMEARPSWSTGGEKGRSSRSGWLRHVEIPRKCWYIYHERASNRSAGRIRTSSASVWWAVKVAVAQTSVGQNKVIFVCISRLVFSRALKKKHL